MRCDGCEKQRSDVRSCGKDSNGDPDAPDLCFVCRKEAEKGRLWDRTTKSYMYPADKGCKPHWPKRALQKALPKDYEGCTCGYDHGYDVPLLSDDERKEVLRRHNEQDD